MQLKPFKFGPVAMPVAATNYLNPPTGAAGVGVTATNQYMIIRHLHVLNKDVVPRAFSLFVGATGGSAAGTEFWGSLISVAANSLMDWYGAFRLEAADFLTGTAATVTTMVISGEGELGVTG